MACPLLSFIHRLKTGWCQLSVFVSIVSLLGVGALTASSAENEPVEVSALMPLPEDTTSMWWKEGFPGVVAEAPWQRCIATGNYGFVLDTASMEIPHLGSLSSEQHLDQLDSAKLELGITANGVRYRCTKGGEWTRHGGPRLIESGRFLQRADVTDLRFVSDSGEILNAETRFETIAWADRLGFVLTASPGRKAIVAGDASFGRVGGGFGLTGTNQFEVENLTISEKFTFEMWAFVPTDYQAGKVSPWLFCKNRNELVDGNIGILITRGGSPEVRLNVGGGKENAYVLKGDRNLNLDAWNHLAVTYDGITLRFYCNGRWTGEMMMQRQRKSVPGGLAIGCRQDQTGDGYRFRGVIDEVRIYDRALNLPELCRHFQKPEFERPVIPAIGEWAFRKDVPASMDKLSEEWSSAELSVKLTQGENCLSSAYSRPVGEVWKALDWKEVALSFDPVTLTEFESGSRIKVTAEEQAKNESLPVSYDSDLGCHRINLDGIEPIASRGFKNPDNNAIERIWITLSNETDLEEIARLNFEKTARGFRQRIGTPITGISAILRDREGNPTGIPVQLSKNWHFDDAAGAYAGQWFHGVAQVRIPPKSEVEMELVLAYGHWGGLPAASHAQLSLIGWGGNQRWDQSALGSWGESICFEPEQVQRGATIMDVRPVLVSPMNDKEKWSWTNNVGGGDFFRLFESDGARVSHRSMQAQYHRYGPCLTEVTYSGKAGKAIEHSETVSLSRTDDLVRATYRIRMDVTGPTVFSRLVFFQVGTDTYNETREAKIAVGDREGLVAEWKTQSGGNQNRSNPVRCRALPYWVSLHDGSPRDEKSKGAWANRGLVIRSWKARLGGKEASPWIVERGVSQYGHDTTSIDVVPPPGVNHLQPGDYLEATVEHLVVPQSAADYYGPNERFQQALKKDGNTWRMIHREAQGNDRSVEVEIGKLERRFPDVRIASDEGRAEFRLEGGVGYIPVTITGLSSPKEGILVVDGNPLDQNVHGNDFWQTDYDLKSKTWSRTYNLPGSLEGSRLIQFLPEK